MIGCCKHPQVFFQATSESVPDLEKLQKLFGDLTAVELKDFEEPRPHTTWVMIRTDQSFEKICTCPCHVRDIGMGVFC